MTYILLLGAGFSNNWGGFLVDEAFDYLLGCEQLDNSSRDLLHKHRRRGGFEAALAEVQGAHFNSGRANPNEQLRNFQDAIRQMFEDMDAAFSKTSFEPQQDIEYMIRTFLIRFDAIFTLNQDVLLERFYLDESVFLGSNGKWNGWEIPGMVLQQHSTPPLHSPNLGLWVPKDPKCFSVHERTQPYFKLHGSMNWFDSTHDGVMVIGGNKMSIIKRYPILDWSHRQFTRHLTLPDTRLMIIGYGFGDYHINSELVSATRTSGLKLFIVDPLGIDAMDLNRDAMLGGPDELAAALQPHVIGASKRSFKETFNTDRVEHSKIMKFFA